MKIVKSLFLFLIVIYTSCKSDKKSTENSVVSELTILQKVANAHGFEEWNKVTQIEFTFNVDRDSTHFERSWIWQPKSNQVTRISGSDTLTYNRKTMDSLALKTNAGFINDRFWLLAPFNLVWDANNFEHSLDTDQTAPISKKSMKKLTIVYGDEGGYTPGDAYDFYLGDDYLIQEWVFRKANQKAPSMITTWENYVAHNGFKFAMDHKKDTENFNLFFTNIVTIRND